MSPTLTQIDWLIVLLSFFSVLAIGLSFRSDIKSASDFFQAGRSVPTWISAFAFTAASLGSLDLIATVAAAAQYGFAAAQFFVIGSIPPLLFAALYVVPALVQSGARTLPEYLRLRFDRRTNLFNAYAFALSTIVIAGLSLLLMARLLQATHVFDPLFFSFNIARSLVFPFVVLVCALVVFLYVLVSGFAAAVVNQAVQFLIVVGAFFPVAWMGLNRVGGFAALKAALPAATTHTGLPIAALIAGMLLSAGYWCTDFRILQFPMAAKNVDAARRIPLIAAAVRLVVPVLLVLVGAIAISLPTPQSATVVRQENGEIFHEITIVPPDAAAGHGLVPARAGADGIPLRDSAAHPQLEYDRAAPAVLLGILPKGLQGLGLAALLAALMCSLAAAVTAFSAVVAFDILPRATLQDENDRQGIAIGRWSSLAFMALAVATAFAFSACKAANLNALDTLLLFLALVNAPQLATFLLGIFTRRISAKGAFAGLFAGYLAALLHYGIALPVGSTPGWHGGWIFPFIHYSSSIAVCLFTALAALFANLLVTVALGFSSESAASELLRNRTLAKAPKKSKARAAKTTWWQRPEPYAAAILLAAIALSILFF